MCAKRRGVYFTVVIAYALNQYPKYLMIGKPDLLVNLTSLSHLSIATVNSLTRTMAMNLCQA